ncbi:MAG: phosphoribosyltransferase family protein [Patescibacteria group bacterium]
MACDREGSLLCDDCAADTSLDGPPFAYANPMIRRLLCAWKYDGDEEGIHGLWRMTKMRLAALQATVAAERIEAIVPVPLSTWKERWRGFSQTRDLARTIGNELNLPTVDCVERRHQFTTQANLSEDVRKTSFSKNPFLVKEHAELPRRVLIVDDVETTGATMEAVEKALRDAGVEVVVKWSLAKG